MNLAVSDQFEWPWLSFKVTRAQEGKWLCVNCLGKKRSMIEYDRIGYSVWTCLSVIMLIFILHDYFSKEITPLYWFCKLFLHWLVFRSLQPCFVQTECNYGDHWAVQSDACWNNGDLHSRLRRYKKVKNGGSLALNRGHCSWLWWIWILGPKYTIIPGIKEHVM